MLCPKCKEADLVIKAGSGMDPDTGYVDQDYCFCPGCGESFDFEDLDREIEQPEKVRSAA